MPKGSRTTRKETQHEKFVRLARENGADEKSAFVGKLKKITTRKQAK